MRSPTKRQREEGEEEERSLCNGGCGRWRGGRAQLPAGATGMSVRARLDTRAGQGSSSGSWRCEKCERLVNQAVIARHGRTFELANVVQCDSGGLIRVKWASAEQLSRTFADQDSAELEWVAERHAALAAKPCESMHFRRGTRVLAQWVDGRFYFATVHGQAAHERVNVEFEDGLRFQPDLSCIRPLLDKPLVPPVARVLSGSFERGERRRSLSQRLTPGGQWNDHTQHINITGARGPLAQSMSELETVWRRSGTWKIDHNVSGISGLYICRDFLSVEEVRCLRRVFAAHQGWAMYEWGSLGRKNELSSVLKRLDFGLPDMTPEGVAASRSSTQPIGDHQQRIIDLFASRMRQVFARGALWQGCEVNMMQLSQIPGGQCLGHHVDRRDKWQEGIASAAWSSMAGEEDERGDCWTLGMQCGPSNNVQRAVEIALPPGSAYMLSKRAQGRTFWCSRRKVAHESCTCCWMHGIWNASDRTRQSITMRVYDSAWGRIVTPEATDTEETPARLPPRRSRRHASTRARVPKLATASAC